MGICQLYFKVFPHFNRCLHPLSTLFLQVALGEEVAAQVGVLVAEVAVQAA